MLGSTTSMWMTFTCQAAKAMDEAIRPPPMAPKRSFASITAFSHGHRLRHFAMSNTGATYPPD